MKKIFLIFTSLILIISMISLTSISNFDRFNGFNGFNIKCANAAVTQVGNILVYYGLSTDTKPVRSTLPIGSKFVETNTGRTFYYNGSSWVGANTYAVTDTVQMSAPGYSAPICTRGYNTLTWNLDIYNINTSVIVGLMVRTVKSGWRLAEAALTYTANGSYGITDPYISASDSAKLYWSSETGGTDTILTHNPVLSNSNTTITGNGTQ